MQFSIMKTIIALMVAILLFAQCKKEDNSIQPTGSYDTLGIHWAVVEETNIIYYFQDFSTQSGYAKDYVAAHESAYTNLNAVFKAQLPQKLRFFIWADANLAAQLLGYQLGFTVPKQCVCHVRPNQTIGHEMTHALVYWSGGIPPTAVTRFVNEGVAVAFDLNTNNKMETAKAALAGQSVQSVRDFWYGSAQSASEEIFYPVAGAFMDFLYKKNLPSQFSALLKNQTITSAENIYSKGQMDALIAEFDGLVGL
jgi:hypothetical protein